MSTSCESEQSPPFVGLETLVWSTELFPSSPDVECDRDPARDRERRGEEQKGEGREEGAVCQTIKKLKGFLCRENIELGIVCSTKRWLPRGNTGISSERLLNENNCRLLSSHRECLCLCWLVPGPKTASSEAAPNF